MCFALLHHYVFLHHAEQTMWGCPRRREVETDDNFICATSDWWSGEKCDYNQSPWEQAGLINLACIYSLCFFFFFVNILATNILINQGTKTWGALRYLQNLINKILANGIKGKFWRNRALKFSYVYIGFQCQWFIFLEKKCFFCSHI